MTSAGTAAYVNEMINATGPDMQQSSFTPEMTSSFTEAEPEGSTLDIDFGTRFVAYSVVAGACLLFNTVSLAALGHIRGPRTVHHRLLTNLAVCDLVGTVMLWMYYNSPHIFPRKVGIFSDDLLKY